MKLDDAIKAILKCGKNALLNKTDIVDAFKQINIWKDQYHLFYLKWRDSYYYYTRLCFGSRSSPYMFDTLSMAICWIAENNYEISIFFHLLDDFLMV